MKAAKVVSALFAVLGTALMLAAVMLCLVCRDAQPRVLRMPREAQDCAQELMDALAAGDYAAAQTLIYGQPDLGAAQEPGSQEAALVWQAFVDSLSYSFSGDCYVTDTGFARDAVVTTLDVEAVTAAVPATAHALLTGRVETAQDMAELYDENNDFRQDLVEQVLLQATRQALSVAGTASYEVRVDLIFRDGQWWAVPDETLLLAISGGVTGG